MKLQEIREIARKRGMKVGRGNKTDLVRAIQKEEGNRDCYATPLVEECNQSVCLWRKDCIEANGRR